MLGRRVGFPSGHTTGSRWLVTTGSEREGGMGGEKTGADGAYAHVTVHMSLCEMLFAKSVCLRQCLINYLIGLWPEFDQLFYIGRQNVPVDTWPRSDQGGSCSIELPPTLSLSFKVKIITPGPNLCNHSPPPPFELQL